jgi:hypothetical protein
MSDFALPENTSRPCEIGLSSRETHPETCVSLIVPRKGSLGLGYNGFLLDVSGFAVSKRVFVTILEEQSKNSLRVRRDPYYTHKFGVLVDLG